ncbi:MAG: MerR family transcriptional regulator [Sedimentibacter sp.]
MIIFLSCQTIYDVAKILGKVPATIRNLEKTSLFIPKRSKNKYCIYDFHDIEIIKRLFSAWL